MSDSDIVTQVLQGDTSGFEVLLRKYAPMVRGLCASHVYDPSALEDLVQESFVAGYVNLHTLRDRRKFGPWIAQITRNKCQSWMRQRMREERGQDRLQLEPSTDAAPDPLSQLARKELCEWIRNQIGSLPDKTREAMLLCYVEGLKIREAAEFLDASESSIKKRLQYGRDQLGEKIWNELGELKQPATDEQPLCKKVMAALPLTSAPWNVGGSAASTVIGGSAVAGKSLAVLGIAAAVMCSIVVWSFTRPDPPRTIEAIRSASPNHPIVESTGVSSGEREVPVHYAVQANDRAQAEPEPPREDPRVNVVDEAGTVSGHVYAHDGRPTPFADITRARPDGSFGKGVATTNAAGFYELQHDGGVVKLRADGKLGTTSEAVTLELDLGESAQQDFVLHPSASARFEIRKPDGTVPEDINFSAVLCRPFDSELIYCSAGMGSVLERDGDLFLLPHIQPGLYCLVVKINGYVTKRFEFSMPADFSDRRFFLPLEHGGYRLTVSIHGERGEPVSNSGVFLFYVESIFSGDSHAQPEAIAVGLEGTSEMGLATFEGLLAGQYQVSALGEKKVIAIPYTGTLAFGNSVSDPAGRGRLRVRAENIQLVDGTHGDSPLTMDSAALYLVSPSGTVSTEWVEPGDNLVVVVKSGYTAAIQPLTVSSEYVAQRAAAGSDEYGRPIHITLGEGGEIFGAIECPQDGDPSGRRIGVLPAACWPTGDSPQKTSGLGRFLSQGARSAADGTFRVPHLPSGEYFVYSEDDLHRAVPATVVSGNETGPITIEAD
ncbi:MAG: hypothetical protein AMXMBFR82_46160 [Candidatus Hydrogenedentota bacterium]